MTIINKKDIKYKDGGWCDMQHVLFTGNKMDLEGPVWLELRGEQVNVIDKGPHPSTKHHFKSVVGLQSK